MRRLSTKGRARGQEIGEQDKGQEEMKGEEGRGRFCRRRAYNEAQEKRKTGRSIYDQSTIVMNKGKAKTKQKVQGQHSIAKEDQVFRNEDKEKGT